MPIRRNRLDLLDGLRGLALCNMIVYHLLYDLVYLFGVSIPWYTGYGAYLWQQGICWSFILISGISFRLGKKPQQRGLLVFGCALILTAVTYFIMPDQLVVFGILHFLGLAMLLTAWMHPLLKKIPSGFGLIGAGALFLFTKGIFQGFLGIGDWALVSLPRAFYQQNFLFWLGFPSTAFSSSDYFPLLPWIFLFWAGYYLWDILEGASFLRVRIPLLSTVGRYSLWIYMAHQPIIYGVTWLVMQVIR